MSGEMEAAGAAVTAGLAAGAIERGEGRVGEAHGACPNCGTTLTGKFCQECGQPAHIHRTLGHLFEEALHGLVHFDAKVWRTLPKLLFRPGTLTREYVMGKRARYISPLALFLLTVFLMFFAFAFIRPDFNVGAAASEQVQAARDRREEAEDRLSDAEDRLAKAQDAVAEARADGAPTAPFELALGAARASVADARAQLEAARRAEEKAVADGKAAEAAVPAAPATDAPSEPPFRGSIGLSTEKGIEAGVGIESRSGLPPGAPWQEQWREAVRRGDIKVNLGDPETNQKALKKLENPDLILYKLQQTAYKFSWLLVPLSIPLVGLLFLWRRGTTWFDHGVFTLYSLSFASLLFILLQAMLIGVPGLAETGPILIAALPMHMFFQLKGAYALSWFSALWRTTLLLIFSGVALGAYLFGIVFITLVT